MIGPFIWRQMILIPAAVVYLFICHRIILDNDNGVSCESRVCVCLCGVSISILFNLDCIQLCWLHLPNKERLKATTRSIWMMHPGNSIQTLMLVVSVSCYLYPSLSLSLSLSSLATLQYDYRVCRLLTLSISKNRNVRLTSSDLFSALKMGLEMKTRRWKLLFDSLRTYILCCVTYRDYWYLAKQCAGVNSNLTVIPSTNFGIKTKRITRYEWEFFTCTHTFISRMINAFHDTWQSAWKTNNNRKSMRQWFEGFGRQCVW